MLKTFLCRVLGCERTGDAAKDAIRRSGELTELVVGRKSWEIGKPSKRLRHPHIGVTEERASSTPIIDGLAAGRSSAGTFGADQVSIDRSMLTLSGLRWCCGTRLTWIWVVQRAHLAVGGDLVIFPLVFGVLGFRLRFPSIFPGREVISINLSAGCPNTRKRSISPTS